MDLYQYEIPHTVPTMCKLAVNITKFTQYTQIQNIHTVFKKIYFIRDGSNTIFCEYECQI